MAREQGTYKCLKGAACRLPVASANPPGTAKKHMTTELPHRSRNSVSFLRGLGGRFLIASPMQEHVCIQAQKIHQHRFGVAPKLSYQSISFDQDPHLQVLAESLQRTCTLGLYAGSPGFAGGKSLTESLVRGRSKQTNFEVSFYIFIRTDRQHHTSVDPSRLS
ncbi:hypothetical protein N658DRAFT_161451 [Parathielavia hyrcaniae]|uniref:Uncharacterized protein n=1 Tax=Parathielavia hyrcaniae TaxID=113614 RepID=A0AAN6PXE4_9PEZI|nr:hypothetical protein N658DRAFT_161451 [Parathielavia hyrcaniae]